MSDEQKPATGATGATGATQFTPRVEAEEGEPTRFDYVVLVLVVVFIVVALLWAFGVIQIPGLG